MKPEELSIFVLQVVKLFIVDTVFTFSRKGLDLNCMVQEWGRLLGLGSPNQLSRTVDVTVRGGWFDDIFILDIGFKKA